MAFKTKNKKYQAYSNKEMRLRENINVKLTILILKDKN